MIMLRTLRKDISTYNEVGVSADGKGRVVQGGPSRIMLCAIRSGTVSIGASNLRIYEPTDV